MALDFPTAPSVGQKYPASPIAGVPTYTWDGEKWTTSGPSLAPIYVARAGDTMSGHLTLPTGPVAANAVRKDYVDAADAAVAGSIAPLSALADSGMQINGSMDVSQEFGAAVTTLTSGQIKYICDGFQCAITGANAQANQNPIASLPGFPLCLLFANTSNNTLAGAGDYQLILQPIEGYRWSRLAFGTSQAQPVTIGFWTWTTVAGTMAVSVRNGSRSYVVDVPLTAASWQYKTVTIPGDVTGTWNTTNGIGAYVTFCYGSGSTYKGAANTWLATNTLATSATTNFFAAPGQIYLTGVVVLPGSLTLTAAQSPYIMRPYDQESMLCKRYYCLPEGGLQMISTGAGNNYGSPYSFPVTMRASPTVVFYQSILSTNAGAVTVISIRPNSFLHYAPSTTAGGSQYMAQFKADARL